MIQEVGAGRYRLGRQVPVTNRRPADRLRRGERAGREPGAPGEDLAALPKLPPFGRTIRPAGQRTSPSIRPDTRCHARQWLSAPPTQPGEIIVQGVVSRRFLAEPHVADRARRREIRLRCAIDVARPSGRRNESPRCRLKSAPHRLYGTKTRVGPTTLRPFASVCNFAGTKPFSLTAPNVT